MKKNVKTTNLLGAGPQLAQLITNHSATLTEKGLKPEEIKTKLTTCCSDVQTDEQVQADAKTALKNATAKLNTTVAQRYSEFSSVIDLLRGAVGNQTALGKQLTNIRKQANGRRARTVSNETDALKAA